MKTNNLIFTIILSALNTFFLCQANPEPTVFLENNYGASIFYKLLPNEHVKEIRNNIRIPLEPLSDLSNKELLISNGSYLSSSYYSLKPVMEKISYSVDQHPNSDIVIYVKPSSFYQQWNISSIWEKRTANISPFKVKEMINQEKKETLLNILMFIKKPVYSQGKGNQQYKGTPESINRTFDKATNLALQMALNEPYGEQVLVELYDIINKQIPFQLHYQDEVNLKQQALTLITTEINRLKQK